MRRIWSMASADISGEIKSMVGSPGISRNRKKRSVTIVRKTKIECKNRRPKNFRASIYPRNTVKFRVHMPGFGPPLRGHRGGNVSPQGFGFRCRVSGVRSLVTVSRQIALSRSQRAKRRSLRSKLNFRLSTPCAVPMHSLSVF